jgi:hypothetical protein
MRLLLDSNLLFDRPSHRFDCENSSRSSPACQIQELKITLAVKQRSCRMLRVTLVVFSKITPTVDSTLMVVFFREITGTGNLGKQDAGCRMQDAGRRTPDAGRKRRTQDAGRGTLLSVFVVRVTLVQTVE